MLCISHTTYFTILNNALTAEISWSCFLVMLTRRKSHVASKDVFGHDRKSRSAKEYTNVWLLQYYKIVIQLLDSVYGFIYTAWAHIPPQLTPRGHMSSSRTIYAGMLIFFLAFKPFYGCPFIWKLYHTNRISIIT